VEDLPTALLAIFYYQSRQKGIRRAAALQQAQKRLREMSQEEFSVYGESMKRHLEAQAQPIKHQYEELVQTSRREKDQERKKELKAEKKRLFREINRYEKAIQQIEDQMREGENKPFSHPYYWSSVVCQGL
jgi:CHAT domain-containing protein